MSTTWDEKQHPRATSGRFAERAGSAPELALVAAQLSAYPQLAVDQTADRLTISDDEETQTCACGNDSLVDDWYAADSTGRLDANLAGSSEPDEHTCCPTCGLVYRNEDIFEGAQAGSVPAVGRFDVASPTFREDRDRYSRDAYGIGWR